METPDGKIGHAELEIGDSLVMLSDPFPQASTRPPKELGGTSVSVFLYVEDVDAFVKQAVEAGATVTMEVADQFWGDRFGSVTDPFGHLWSIATLGRGRRRHAGGPVLGQRWVRAPTPARLPRSKRKRAATCALAPHELS